MVGRKNTAVIARRQAHDRLGPKRSKQADPNQVNENDLAQYLLLKQCIDAAHIECATALSAAQYRRDNVATMLRQRPGECSRRISSRGDIGDNITHRTGLPVKDRQIINDCQHPDPASERWTVR